MNCDECRKEYQEIEEDDFVSIAAMIHRFLCPECRQEIAELERAIVLLRDDPDTDVPEDFSDAILSRLTEAEEEDPAPFKIGRWLTAGGLLFISFLIVSIAKPYMAARGMYGEAFLVPLSIVLGVSISIYSVAFIASHMEEISSLIHLKKNG